MEWWPGNNYVTLRRNLRQQINNKHLKSISFICMQRQHLQDNSRLMLKNYINNKQ